MVQCPVHDDQRESLSIAEGDDGRALLLCFAGCPTTDVVEALGLAMADLFADYRGSAVVQQYVYTDEDGAPLTRVLRTYPKGFTQESWDTRTETWRSRLLDARRVPYHLPQLLAADQVWVVEGEKDVEAMERAGEVATTLMGGAGKWRDEYAPYFRGKTVAFVADIDEPDRMGRRPGIEGVLRVKNALRGVAKGLAVYQAKAGKDAADHFNAGYSVEDLIPVPTISDAVFEPMTWSDYKTEETDWLFEPYVPRASRVLAYGPKGSLKSLWAMWLGVRLAKEGHRVAYFSLEMRPGEMAKRLKKMDPPADRFRWYSRFSFSSAAHLDAAIELLRGYSLIVIDSWSAAATQMELRDSNQAVARLDQEVFQPLIDETGAALLILDNTGHPSTDRDGKSTTPPWARGASAKVDKVEIELMFERPNLGDNHTVTISMNKMRLDLKMPKPVTITTDPHDINFVVIDKKTGASLGPLWSYFGDVASLPAAQAERPTSLLERLRQARDRASLGEQGLGYRHGDQADQAHPVQPEREGPGQERPLRGEREGPSQEPEPAVAEDPGAPTEETQAVGGETP